MNYTPQVGDIILEDSDRLGAEIVKFFMTAPSIWHYIFRAIRKTQEKVDYYHVAMVYKVEENSTKIMEQQSKVKISDINLDTKQIIFRRKDLNNIKQLMLTYVAELDIGEGYDVLNVIGKFLTWLTAFPLFARYIEVPELEICVNRVAYWYSVILEEDFGVLYHSELTTQMMYKYLINNSNYEVVYKKD